MKKSKLIELLNQIPKDLEVFIYNPEYDEPYLEPSLSTKELVNLNEGIQDMESVYKMISFKAIVLN